MTHELVLGFQPVLLDPDERAVIGIRNSSRSCGTSIANVPADLAVHLILDHYATHKHAKVKAWLAARPRYHMHFTPTYSSWLNQVEPWFGLITQRAIRRGSFRSVHEFIRRIETFVERYNAISHPFAWTATADPILAKLYRLLKATNGSIH